jgi:hypothetical protein
MLNVNYMKYYSNIFQVPCSSFSNLFFDVFVENDWEGESELWSECWLPFSWLNGFEDWVKDVLFNELEDCNADSIKWSPDQSHKLVPGPHDPVWDESKNLPEP